MKRKVCILLVVSLLFSVVPAQASLLKTWTYNIKKLYPGIERVSESDGHFSVAADDPDFATIDNVLFEKNTKTLIRIGSREATDTYDVPNGIHIIGPWAFTRTSCFNNIVLPSTVELIDKYAFCECSAESVIIPEGVKEIGYRAFDNSSIKSIVLPESLTSIGQYAFFDSSVTSVNIPNSVVSIGKGVFASCKELTADNVTISDDHPVFAIRDDCLINKKSKEIIAYLGGDKHIQYTTPQGMITIGDDAFSHYSGIEELIISEGITTIGEYAFHLSSVKEVVMPESLTTIKSNAFSHCYELVKVNLPASVTTIESEAFTKIPFVSADTVFDIIPGTYAMDYCKRNSFKYNAPVTDDDSWLNN